MNQATSSLATSDGVSDSTGVADYTRTPNQYVT